MKTSFLRRTTYKVAQPEQRCRAGLSLMEVMVSLAMFLLAFAVIGQLFSLGSDRAMVAQFREEGLYLCQAKLAELEAGIATLESQSNLVFENNEKWTWSCTCTKIQEDKPGLWQVKVRVERQRQLGGPIIVTLSKFIVDPADRGSTLDPNPLPAVEEEEEEPATDSNTRGN